MALTTNNRLTSVLKKRNPLSTEAVAYSYLYRR